MHGPAGIQMMVNIVPKEMKRKSEFHQVKADRLVYYNQTSAVDLWNLILSW